MKSDKAVVILLTVLIFSSIISLCFGSVKISINTQSGLYILKYMRLPRTIGAVLAGSCLALSGLVFQGVFKNPLADSYMLGISSCSSFCICLALLFFNSLSKSLSLSVFSLFGSLICSVFIFNRRNNNSMRLILTGIAVNFFFSAGTTLIIFLNRKQLDTVLFWTMGSLSNMTWAKVCIMFFITIVFSALVYRERYSMDILLLDESTAYSIGLNPENKRKYLLIISSVATAVTVSYCGVIGFVGIISAHIIRLLLGPKHKNIILPTILFGASFLVLSDLISRVIVAPSELPIGVITSIAGAPILFFLIKRDKSWKI